MTGLSAVRTDCNLFVGGYPFRHLPHPDAGTLARVLAREGTSIGWVGHLPSAFYRDPMPGNEELFRELAPHRSLKPVPTIRPDWPGWESAIARYVGLGAVAVRTYPQCLGFSPDDARLIALGTELARHNLPLVLTIRFEDARQRAMTDTTPDLTPAHVRQLARAATGVRIIVTAASREFIEEVHWGLMPRERAHVFYDISWLWGPPTDEFSHLLRTVGSDRFVWGSMWPLRLVQTPRALMALREADVAGLQLSNPG